MLWMFGFRLDGGVVANASVSVLGRNIFDDTPVWELSDGELTDRVVGFALTIAGTDRAEELAEVETLGLSEFTTPPVGGHAVCLVDDDQVPFAAREPVGDLLIARQLIHAGDHDRMCGKRVGVDAGVDQLTCEDGCGDAELGIEFVLPLIHEPAGRDDQQTREVAPQHQFLGVEPGHHRLAGTGIVGKEES